MGYVTENTVWPTSVQLDQSIKDLLDLFYTLADDKSADAGPRLSKEVFSKDGVMGAAAGVAKGEEAISHSRDKAWTTVASRLHTVQQVFVNDAAGRDLLLLGQLEQKFTNGNEVTGKFTSRFVVDADSHATGQPRFKLMEVFADTAPFVAAAKG